ncbi:hypothetical protein EVAR_81966_1 [Eumeta japonica]|uniref:Uncharacterized protein n=1 Tax=Eumeta variegata TaxID=151549 RepID=A0A4C1VTN2_EUMVA|nr:hypothetical protein EVAR_81966_1 [Eumeta japonica]
MPEKVGFGHAAIADSRPFEDEAFGRSAVYSSHCRGISTYNFSVSDCRARTSTPAHAGPTIFVADAMKTSNTSRLDVLCEAGVKDLIRTSMILDLEPLMISQYGSGVANDRCHQRGDNIGGRWLTVPSKSWSKWSRFELPTDEDAAADSVMECHHSHLNRIVLSYIKKNNFTPNASILFKTTTSFT